MKRQIQVSLAIITVSVLAIVALSFRRDPVLAATVGAFALTGVAIYGAWALRRGRHTPWAEASQLVAPGRAVVFWKPGCPYCERLLKAIGDDDRVIWVNVWQDATARARVCELNDGNEYTPTALVGPDVLRNPSAAEVLAAIGA